MTSIVSVHQMFFGDELMFWVFLNDGSVYKYWPDRDVGDDWEHYDDCPVCTRR